MESSDLSIGSRIYFDGDFGTVLYVGELESLEGIWLGVEWDNLSRGKHDGSHNNIKYFSTRFPNSGSFIRLKKAETGISCPRAIIERYGNANDSSNIVDITPLPQKAGRDRVIEFVGAKKITVKQSQFDKLEEVVVSRMLVNGPGTPGELAELIPNAINLDLSCNLLSSWTDVTAIAEQLPYLQSLNVSKNRLKIPDDGQNFQKCFKMVKILILNNSAYNWNQVLSCATMWPYVEHLDLWANEIESLTEPSYPIFCQLHFLNLEGNPIGSWQEICKLGEISSLEELYIDNINLMSISFPDVPPTEKTELFPNLRSLSVRNNKLAKWQDIAELNKLTKLNELKISNNPIVLSVTPETARQLVIAKIVGLQRINRSEVSEERRGAEVDYIKLYHKDWIASGGNRETEHNNPSQEFLTEHPTYMMLVQKSAKFVYLLEHGAAEDSEVNKPNSLLKNNLLSLEISSPMMPDKLPVIKKLPDTMTVSKLKALIQRIFNINAQDIKITYKNVKDDCGEMEIDNELRQLSFYSLSNSDKIFVRW